MVFEVLLDSKAAKALRKLNDTNRVRMRKALGEVAVDPWKAGKPLHPSNFWGVRSGDYRAVYEINADQNQVIVLFIGHRKNVYDDFSKML
ncbi:MAG TPA: type II toxin-antitoxin system RelE/ParE family toxin [Candidatus Bathyarchaeia archaeon]|nr:type II toxin-antitoxin system RelE/ParE family toxin [Candidatus Bathyarchaeia archaeon]